MFNNHYLSTRTHLEEVKVYFPNDIRLEIYDTLFNAVSKIDPSCFLTITTTTPITDEVAFEGLCRRFAHQLHRIVLGQRTKSKIPMLFVLEANASGTLHAHVIVGKIQGASRSLNDTEFKLYIQKQTFPAIFKILKRLTYRGSSKRLGKIGVCYIKPVSSTAGLIDYLFKASKLNLLNIAWLASNIDFSDSDTSECPRHSECPK